MKYSFFLILAFKCTLLFAQKPPLDTNNIKTWVSVGAGFISDDGNYVGYYFFNKPYGKWSLSVRSTRDDWRRELVDAYPARFSADSRLLVFKRGKDSLGLMSLGGERIDYVAGAEAFDLFDTDSTEWLVYRLAAPGKGIIVRNLNDRTERQYADVLQYSFSAAGALLITKSPTRDKDDESGELRILDLKSGETREVWPRHGAQGEVLDYAISQDGKQMVLIIHGMNAEQNSVWLYRRDDDSAFELPMGPLGSTQGTLRIGGGLSFNHDGTEIFLSLYPASCCKSDPKGVNVDVWSYTDKTIQAIQLDDKDQDNSYSGVYNIKTNTLRRLEQDTERIFSSSGNFALLESPAGSISSTAESGWNVTVRPSYYLISVQDPTTRIRISGPLSTTVGKPEFSPGGKWLVYFDLKQRNYFSYEIATGIRRNITREISTDWLSDDIDYPKFMLAGGARPKTWLKDDAAVLIRDNYDLWLVDPEGRNKPVCLTNGFGRSHHIKFSVVDDKMIIQRLAVNSTEPIWLEAIDKTNEDRGFFTCSPGTKGDPKMLVMGPYVYGDWSGHTSGSIVPIKARAARCYLIKRMSAREAPNYFVTTDFIHFSPMSDIRPQQDINWMTTELVHWKTFDGRRSTGILYKPENFDASKKYPMIFDYYERRSDELNLYIEPALSRDRINIPYYVSNGYLVFVPDIGYKTGEPGKSAYNSVVSAAVYLSKKNWVDKTHMGIQGHSFGGYETNYIVTHSKLFAAACAASGVSDLVSDYGTVLGNFFHQFWNEETQGRMGGTLWMRQKEYIENSPIFRADKVVTPLLLMNNKEDHSVAFSQGIEFFMALRRLGKRVWLLQYDGQGHSITTTGYPMDYTIRMKQFFDHYLKGARPPKWMTTGVPARFKGWDSGLELDRAISTPGKGVTEK